MNAATLSVSAATYSVGGHLVFSVCLFLNEFCSTATKFMILYPPLVELDIKNTSLADMIYLLQNLYYT